MCPSSGLWGAVLDCDSQFTILSPISFDGPQLWRSISVCSSLYLLTPAHCILSPNLQARFCKLYPADFWLQFTCFCVPSFQDFFAYRLFQKSPPGMFSNSLRARGLCVSPAAPSARAFDVTAHLSKAPSHCVQVKWSLIFLEMTSLLGLLIATDKIGRIELAESNLQIRTSNFLSKNPSCHRRSDQSL